MNKIDRFYEIKYLLKCPRCGKKIRFHAGGLVCKKEHRFDISSKGYVNFLQENRTLKGYDNSFFASRARFMQAGYYDHIIDAVCGKAEQAAREAIFRSSQKSEMTGEVERSVQNPVGAFFERSAVGVQKKDDVSGEPFVVADTGCGEGSYSSRLAERLTMAGLPYQCIAFDISADAVKIASKSKEDVKWLVADITNIPLKSETADCILDIFTPANYGEFSRILKPGGTIIKVIPAPCHMQQLRQAAAHLLRNSNYSGEEVSDYFEKHFEVTDRFTVSKTFAIGASELGELIKMTPLLFDVDKKAIDLDCIKEITVGAEILIGKVRT